MIKAILFDKDGTLIEFNTLWLQSTYQLVESLVAQYANDAKQHIKVDTIARLLGMEEEGVAEHSVLASKTSEDIATIIADELGVDQQIIHEKVNNFYYKHARENRSEIKSIGDVHALFQQLKQNELMIGVVTADNYDVTELTLAQLQVSDQVDFIATADRYEKKPNEEAMDIFCRTFNLKRDEVIHVGDTPTDMEFSRHGRFGVGVLSGVGSETTLKQYTPHVIASIQQLIDNKGKFIYH
ncbi:HAD family hydrolase [Pontibacillus litoralis]|uniref:Haloacid dehalogenase n=1 Tax=Pontibacillus litoralis JSM 072002 TaxID=1385512 RepID=A0A0A5G1V4_9BACI|nr:HAD family hydrolase [Pontibacillus litoralis]KGX87076.1 hypothetical protein N784_02450 [Pontibacillus litoralis JSM 072002]